MEQQKYNNPHECPHMLKMYDTPICIVYMKPCMNVHPCPREEEQKDRDPVV